MAGILMTFFRAGINPLTFIENNYLFSKSGRGDNEEERKCQHLVEEKLQTGKDKWNEDRRKQPDFINHIPCQENEAKAYINNADEAMVEYCQVFAKQIKLLPPEPQLSDFYHPSEVQKNGELLLVTVGKLLVTYAPYNCLKQMTEDKLDKAPYQSDHLWTGRKTFRELNKIFTIRNKFFKSR